MSLNDSSCQLAIWPSIMGTIMRPSWYDEMGGCRYLKLALLDCYSFKTIKALADKGAVKNLSRWDLKSVLTNGTLSSNERKYQNCKKYFLELKRMATKSNAPWKFFLITMMTLTLITTGKANADTNRQIWLRETDSAACESDVLDSFELGKGLRWQLLASKNHFNDEWLKNKITLKSWEVLAFTEGALLQPLGKDIRIIQSKGSSTLLAGSAKSLGLLHTNSRFFIKLIDPSRIEEQGCGQPAPRPDTIGVRDLNSARQLKQLKPLAVSPVKIDATYLVQSLREFSGDLPIATGRIQERGSARGREAGQAYLKEEFSKLGLKVEQQCFTSGAFKGCNILGVLPGKTNQVVVVSAHADSEKNAGADDDGTGISALLAIAKSMKSATWNVTLHFVGFDLEEKGLLGSKAYVKEQIKLKTPIKGNINLEMLGYDSDNDGAFHVIDCERKESLKLVNIVKQSAAERKSLQASPYCTNRSDHASFWNAGIPAVVISENFFGGDGNPCYHASCDKFDKINTTYLNNLVELAGSVIAKFSEDN